jgi:glycosyltransferase involved in cell wall biosynthesis
MKIALVGPIYPYRGGIAHYTALLAMHLEQQHSIQVYTYDRQYPTWLYPGRSQMDPAAPLAEVKAKRWLIPWWPVTWWKVQQDWAIWRPEVAVFQWWVPFMAPMTTWLASRARRLNTRVVMICHNVLPHERSRLDAALVRMTLSKADRLIVHSEDERRRARQLNLAGSIEVTPLPTYSAFSSAAWSKERARAAIGIEGRVVLFFGLVRPYKGLSDLLDALPAVLAEFDVTLLVVGEIWGKSEPYRSRVKTLGLESRVRFVDRYVSNDEVAMYFAACDLAILPYREATGSAVLQLAFGLGVPVVATRTGGMGEVVEDGVTGFLVEPGDSDGLSQAIVRFFEDSHDQPMRQALAQLDASASWNRLIEFIETSSKGQSSEK